MITNENNTGGADSNVRFNQSNFFENNNDSRNSKFNLLPEKQNLTLIDDKRSPKKASKMPTIRELESENYRNKSKKSNQASSNQIVLYQKDSKLSSKGSFNIVPNKVVDFHESSKFPSVQEAVKKPILNNENPSSNEEKKTYCEELEKNRYLFRKDKIV